MISQRQIEADAAVLVQYIATEALVSELQRWDENWADEEFYTPPATYAVLKEAVKLAREYDYND